MPSFTKNYSLAFFDYGEELGTDAAIDSERQRWSLLDRMLYGLMSLFGDGIISGWDITASGDTLGIEISSGNGHINHYSCRSTFPYQLTLETNSIHYIYAIVDVDTPTDETVGFVYTLSPVVGSSNYLFLGKVTTGPVSITEIDSSGRTEIDFLDEIQEEIRQHKHRGGTLHPSKIDLETDVKNQLPSSRIEPFDASKITTGTLDLVRLPSISHTLLDNIGQLTHAQLDSFVAALETNNKELFGEVATPNMLQQHILMKYLFDDSASPLYVTTGATDKDLYNEFIIIPGLSPNEYLDRENTTAIIDLERREIRGIPPVQGSSFYVHYDTDLAWNEAYVMENVNSLNNKVIMTKSRDETAQVIVESFEGVSQDDQLLSDGTIFKKEIINLDPDEAKIVSEGSQVNVVDGAFSAKISNVQSFRLQYVKEFSTNQDWSEYTTFLIDVKTETKVHGTVKLYFVSSSNKESPHFILLEADETTENDDHNGFETRIIDLTAIDFLDSLKKIVIYTDDLSNPLIFYIDNLTIQKEILLPEEGRLVIRYASSSPIVFSSIDWNSTEPDGTSLKVRARSADGTVLLNRSEYTSWLVSGEQISLRGTDIEIEVLFYSDVTRVYAPVLNSMKIAVLSDAETGGFEIDETTELARGTLSNVRVVPTSGGKATLSLETPVYVSSHYFIDGRDVQQIYEQTDSTGTYSASEIAVFGTGTPISPNWILSRVEQAGQGVTVSSCSFFDPRSVLRLQNRNFLIADTFNDRIIEMDENGSIVSGYGSINYSWDKLFPIAATVDVRTGILYLVWSRSVPFKVVNVDRISVKTSTTTVPLRDNYDKPYNYTKAELNELDIEGQIMPIYLMDQNFSQIKNMTGNVYVYVENDVIDGGIDASSVYYKAIKTIGIPCFVGNFAYKTGIHAPTCATSTTDNGYVICNGTYAVKEFKVPSGVEETVTHNTSFSDIVEIDEDGNSLWSAPTNWVKFSPFFPGRAEQVDKNTLLIAGTKPGSETTITTPAELTFTSLSTNPETLATQKEVLKGIFEGKVGNAGVISDYNTSSWSYSIGPYVSAEAVLISDACLNADGNLVVAESSFDRSGRILTVDNFGMNIFSFGEGTYSLISSIRMNEGGLITVTT